MEQKSKILITGAGGFLAKNLINYLEKQHNYIEILQYDVNNNISDLEHFCQEADFIFHFASVQRPKIANDYSPNYTITNSLINILEKNMKNTPIFFSSSIHADNENEYGRVKKIEENIILDYARRNNTKCYIWRFNNLFGKYSKPNYTSVISTFCFNALNNIPIQINDVSTKIPFSYVDDAIEEIIISIRNGINFNQINYLKVKYIVSLGELAYYVSTLKNNDINYIKNNASFYNKLSLVYNWFRDEYKC